jgi:SRSO17 transposase
VANCQVAVTLHWSSQQTGCPPGWRLYLPRAWIEDQARARDMKLPGGLVYRSRAELALELTDQMLSWEIPQLPVVGDSAYGNSFEF